MMKIDENDNSICSYVQYNSKTLFAGKSDGLYCIVYYYELENDTPEFTPESAIALYEKNENNISHDISAEISSHVETMHNVGSTAALINDYMPTSFPLSNFTVSNGTDSEIT